MKKILCMLTLLALLAACDDDDSFAGPSDKNSESSDYQESSSSKKGSSSSSTKENSSSSTEKNSSSSKKSSTADHSADCKGYPSNVLCDPRDGQVYRIFKYGNQEWMAENLNYAMEGSYCYDDQDSNCVKYGRLYLWTKVNEACPEGWHVPYEEEYKELFNAVGGMKTAGWMLKSDSGWYVSSSNSKSGGGKGIYSFSILPAGERDKEHKYDELTFEALFWMTARFDNGKTKSVVFTYDEEDPYFRNAKIESTLEEALSIRCIRGELEDIVPVEPSGETGTITDSRDGQVYKTVKIGDQWWMAENLNYDYNEGTAMGLCYDSVDADCKKFGRFYNWSAIVDSAGIFGTEGVGCGDSATCVLPRKYRGICPEGWHLPDSLELEELIHSVGGTFTACRALKSTEGWSECTDPKGVESNGTDKYGFNALPTGSGYTDGRFGRVGTETMIWGVTAMEYGYAYSIWIRECGEAYVTYLGGKGRAYNVRCLKD